MIEILPTFLLAGYEFMPKADLGQPEFTDSVDHILKTKQ